MAATPETLQVETPQVVETPEEFPETLQVSSSGAQVVQKNFTSQVADDKGNPIIQTPPTQVVTTVTPPSDTVALTSQSKGKITESATWLAAFWLRIIKKAIFFGWKILGSSNPN
jgi:hypothetical protein